MYLPSQDITADESLTLERYPVFHALFLSDSHQLWNVTLSSVDPVENVWYFMIYTDCGKAQIGPRSWWIDVNKTATCVGSRSHPHIGHFYNSLIWWAVYWRQWTSLLVQWLWNWFVFGSVLRELPHKCPVLPGVQQTS